MVANLAANGVSAPTDFDWQAQLRSYWEEDKTGNRENTTMMRIMSAEIEYGYEYLGNSSRLVITPLTDRCYRTLMGAIHLTMGGAPEGPAGTGKGKFRPFTHSPIHPFNAHYIYVISLFIEVSVWSVSCLTDQRTCDLLKTTRSMTDSVEASK